MKLAVDCWVRTGHLDVDMVHCLREFVAQGGSVKESAYAIMDAVEANASATIIAQRVHPSSYTFPCEQFYSDASVKYLIEEMDADALKLLNGGWTCCGDLSYPPIERNMTWPGGGNRRHDHIQTAPYHG